MQPGRITKIIGFSVPPALVGEVEKIAKKEHRTKSELFREMLRVYLSYRKQREMYDDKWVIDIIEQAKKEQEIKPMLSEEILAESEKLRKYGLKQAEKLGIGSKDIDHLLHEYKKRKRAS